MRISTILHSEHYHPLAIHAVPYVDGDMVRGCVLVDEEQGYAIVMERDDNGKIMMADARTPSMRIVWGRKVWIHWPEPWIKAEILRSQRAKGLA